MLFYRLMPADKRMPCKLKTGFLQLPTAMQCTLPGTNVTHLWKREGSEKRPWCTYFQLTLAVWRNRRGFIAQNQMEIGEVKTTLDNVHGNTQ